MTGALLARLLPTVRGMIPAEGRAALGSVIQVAQGADLIGPPPLSPDAVAGCQVVARELVPWQLIAAAVYARPNATGPQLAALVDGVSAGELVPAVVEWAGREVAGLILWDYLVLLVRELEPEGLGALLEVFGP